MGRQYRRPRAPLSVDQVGEIVRRRDAGETWMSIGRDIGKQDGVLKRVYELAKCSFGPIDDALAA